MDFERSLTAWLREKSHQKVTLVWVRVPLLKWLEINLQDLCSKRTAAQFLRSSPF